MSFPGATIAITTKPDVVDTIYLSLQEYQLLVSTIRDYLECTENSASFDENDNDYNAIVNLICKIDIMSITTTHEMMRSQ